MSGWTQTPNFIYDLMPEMKEAEIKVVMLIVRQTIGWQRESVSLSVSDFKRMTRLAQASVVSGIKAALERGIIERTEDKNSYIYKIIEPVCESESVQILNRFEQPVQNLNGNGSHSEPITVQNLNDQSVQNLNDTNININTNKPTTEPEKGIAADAAPPSHPDAVSISETPKPKRSRKSRTPPDSAAPPPREPSEWQLYLEALCWVCYGHKDIGSLTEAKRGQLTSEGKAIRGKDFTIDDLRKWYTTVWSQSWQRQKDKLARPSPAEVRSSIAQVRAEVPEGFEEIGARNGHYANGNGKVASNLAAIDQYEEIKFRHGVNP